MNTISSSGVSSSGDQKSHALISYILMIIGLFTAIPLFIGAIWAMFTHSSAKGSIYHSHYTNAIRTFWWSLFWCIVGGIVMLMAIGWIVWGIVWLWVLYRTVYGLAKLVADEPYPL